MNDGIKCLWNPDQESIDRCVTFGNDVATQA
jgi:hypothetical protein